MDFSALADDQYAVTDFPEPLFGADTAFLEEMQRKICGEKINESADADTRKKHKHRLIISAG